MYNDENRIAIQRFIGAIITSVDLHDDKLYLWFSNGGLKIYDDGQSCCENRYMTTSDNFELFIGDKFIGFEIVDAPNLPDENNDHEVQFLKILTDKGSFIMESHNEHNGYYGGFLISIEHVFKN